MTATTIRKTRDNGRGPRRRRGAGATNSSIIGQSRATPYLFSLPAIILVAAILGFPVLYGVWQSLYTRETLGSPLEWVGFQNYVDMFQSATFFHALDRTAIFVCG